MIIRCLFGDRHIVRVRFAEGGAGDADELATLLYIADGGGASVAHRRAEAADHLVHRFGKRTAEGDTSLDALGYKLLQALFGILEIAIGSTLCHRGDGTHTTVGLVGAAF